MPISGITIAMARNKAFRAKIMHSAIWCSYFAMQSGNRLGNLLLNCGKATSHLME